MLSVSLALAAGFCAAIASLCAKLTFSPQHVFDDACKFVDFWIVGCYAQCDMVSNDLCQCFSTLLLFLKTFEV